MKIAISSTGPDPDAQVDLRFGRCQYFVLVDWSRFFYTPQHLV